MATGKNPLDEFTDTLKKVIEGVDSAKPLADFLLGDEPRAKVMTKPERVVLHAKVIPNCDVCGDTKRVGRKGHKVLCPNCAKA
jgi:hypothetical protein